MMANRYVDVGEDLQFGGFGEVRLLHDNFLGRKILCKSMSNPDNNDQLYNEIIALSKARSRHVVEIYDVLFDKNRNVSGIIIEYLDGRDFSKFYLEYENNPEEFLKILFQIASGLYDLHQAGITHRDMKLENIKASNAGVVKIFDFGISAITDDYITKNNRGTLIYAAPELYFENARISREMDIYAFGIIAWNLVTTQNNFDRALLDTPPHSKHKYQSIAHVCKNKLPEEIINLIDATLCPNPANRPTIEEIVPLLAKYLVIHKHKGIFTENARNVYELSSVQKGVKLKIAPLGEIDIYYDGLEFKITYVDGDVFINNMRPNVNTVLPNSCLLTFGAPHLRNRRFMTFSSSHPEVVL
ncbi:TPA: serine/threonine-protein kinase [Salmonella enterica]|uniref:serine/threonine-protein kinase n=1 Tax=Klebsiella pneumoniae TaxID=573 RepID=UPI00363089DF